jgi:3-oxoacyl-[acyl-carrier protein] reductase
MSDLSNTTTIVVGASRGLGRGIATAFAEGGAPVGRRLPQRDAVS